MTNMRRNLFPSLPGLSRQSMVVDYRHKGGHDACYDRAINWMMLRQAQHEGGEILVQSKPDEIRTSLILSLTKDEAAS